MALVLDMTPKAKAAKTKIDKWDAIKPKRSYRAKEIYNRIRDNLRNGENICELMRD